MSTGPRIHLLLQERLHLRQLGLQQLADLPLEHVALVVPLLEALVVLDELEQLHIFVELPRPFFELRTEITSPVLPALLGVPEHFVLVRVEVVQLLRDALPLLDGFSLSVVGQLRLHYPGEQF